MSFLVHRHFAGCLLRLSLVYIIKYEYKGSKVYIRRGRLPFVLDTFTRVSVCSIYDVFVLYIGQILIENSR